MKELTSKRAMKLAILVCDSERGEADSYSCRVCFNAPPRHMNAAVVLREVSSVVEESLQRVTNRPGARFPQNLSIKFGLAIKNNV